MGKKINFFFFIVLLSLSSFGFLTPVKASSYSLNLKEKENLIYEIKSWDSDITDDIFGDHKIESILGHGARVGAMQCKAVTHTDKRTDYWAIEGYVWTGEWNENGELINVWVDDKAEFNDIDSEEVEIYEEGDLVFYRDPEDWGEDIDLESAIQIINKLRLGCPNPVEQYLQNIDWSVKDLSISGPIIKFKINKEDSEFEDDIVVEYRWDLNGVYQGEKWYTSEKEPRLIFEIGLQETPFDYLLPVFIIVLAVSVICIIFIFVRKKRGSKK